MIKKSWSVLDSLQLDTYGILGRLAEAASEQFSVIFREVDDYKLSNERKSVEGISEHDRIAKRLQNYIESVWTKGPWDSEKVGASSDNSALAAYLLAGQR